MKIEIQLIGIVTVPWLCPGSSIQLKKLWQELDNFRPNPVVSCVDDWKVVSKMCEYRDSNQVIRFLKGLNEQYSIVRSQFMLMEPLPNIGKVYSLLAQQKRQAVIPLDESKILVAAKFTPTYGRGSMSRGRTSYGRGKGLIVCSYSKRNGNTIDTCWKKYGYPPHLQQNSLVNNYVNTNSNEENSQYVAYEEENHYSDNGKLVITP